MKLEKILKKLTKFAYYEVGAKCEDYDKDCIVCRTWESIDNLKDIWEETT